MVETLRYRNGRGKQGAFILENNWSIFTQIFKYPFTLTHFYKFILTAMLVFTPRTVCVTMLNAKSFVITKSAQQQKRKLSISGKVIKKYCGGQTMQPFTKKGGTTIYR